MVEEPLNGLAITPVTKLPGKLEYARGAECRDTDAGATALHLLVAVLGAGAAVEGQDKLLGFSFSGVIREELWSCGVCNG